MLPSPAVCPRRQVGSAVRHVVLRDEQPPSLHLLRRSKPSIVSPSRSRASSSSVRDVRGRRWRILGVLLLLLLFALVAWGALVASVWGYAWLRLSGDEIARPADDLQALGSTEVSAPEGTTTLLVVLTDSDGGAVPAPLLGPVVLLQYGGPREAPVALVLPQELPVTVDGAGEVSLAEVQRQGGADLLVRAVIDYTQIRIDHVVSASVDLLPQLLAALGAEGACGGDAAGCPRPTVEDLRVSATQSSPPEVVADVEELIHAVAEELRPGWVLRSPLAAKRVVQVVEEGIRTDVALRGSRLLQVAAALRSAEDLEVITLPAVTHPDTGRPMVLPEPAAVRFQHLREGTSPDPGQGRGTNEALLRDVTVAVLNGAGVDGLAAGVQVRLEARGFRVIGSGNATSFGHRRTTVHYRRGDPGVETAAALLVQELDGAALESLDRHPTFEGQEVDLLVTAGLDLNES